MAPIISIISLTSLLFIPDALARDTADSGATDPNVEVAIESVTSGDEASVVVETYTPQGQLLSVVESVVTGEDGLQAFTIGTDGCLDEDLACRGQRGWSSETITIIVETYPPTGNEAGLGLDPVFVLVPNEIIDPHYVVDGDNPYDAPVYEDHTLVQDELGVSVAGMLEQDWISISPIPTPTP